MISEKEKAELQKLRELYYEEHCPRCNSPSYPIVVSAKFLCSHCHKQYQKTFNWPATTIVFITEEHV